VLSNIRGDIVSSHVGREGVEVWSEVELDIEARVYRGRVPRGLLSTKGSVIGSRPLTRLQGGGTKVEETRRSVPGTDLRE
jgi:hypothetical protein